MVRASMKEWPAFPALHCHSQEDFGPVLPAQLFFISLQEPEILQN